MDLHHNNKSLPLFMWQVEQLEALGVHTFGMVVETNGTYTKLCSSLGLVFFKQSYPLIGNSFTQHVCGK